MEPRRRVGNEWLSRKGNTVYDTMIASCWLYRITISRV